MKRGLSLVEMLVALSLLGMLMLALVSWTRFGLGATRSVAERERWDAAAETVLQLVQEDLLSGDFPAPAEAPRVTSEAGSLGVRTRRLHPPGGALLREYAFDPLRKRLTVHERAPGAGRSQGAALEPSLLLEDVSSWSCTLDQKEGRLDLAIRSVGGAVKERSYRLP